MKSFHLLLLIKIAHIHNFFVAKKKKIKFNNFLLN